MMKNLVRFLKAFSITFIFLWLPILLISSCHNGTKENPNLPALISKSLFDSVVAHCDKQDSNNQVLLHRLYAIDSNLIVDSNSLEDSVKALRKTLFLAEFRLARIDYHLKLVISRPSKFEKDLQGWVDRDAHYELNLDDGSNIRKLLLPQAKKDIDSEIHLK